MTELKSCPFCGGLPITEVHYWKCGAGELELVASVICTKCDTSKSVRFGANNKSFADFENAFAKAKNLWNSRV